MEPLFFSRMPTYWFVFVLSFMSINCFDRSCFGERPGEMEQKVLSNQSAEVLRSFVVYLATPALGRFFFGPWLFDRLGGR